MANKEEKPEGVKDSSWKEFIYNPRTGEFLGRTASSWERIEVEQEPQMYDDSFVRLLEGGN